MEMQPEDGILEPLVGYLPLEQSPAGLDMLNHRSVRVNHIDLKKALRCRNFRLLNLQRLSCPPK